MAKATCSLALAGGVEAELEKAAIPETVDRAEASEEAALMEEASPAQGTQGLKLFR